MLGCMNARPLDKYRSINDAQFPRIIKSEGMQHALAEAAANLTLKER